MGDCVGMTTTIFGLVGLIGLGLVVIGLLTRARALRLVRRYESADFRSARDGHAVRVRGRVAPLPSPRWHDPRDGEPVALARLVARNSVKRVLDISRGQNFELDDGSGELARVDVGGAEIQGRGEPITLSWPMPERLRAFLTGGSGPIVEELCRRGGRNLGTLIAAKSGDEVEVCGLARRDAERPQGRGYRDASAQLVLGSSEDVPVVVLIPTLDSRLALARDQLLSGGAAFGLAALVLGVVWGLAAWFG